MYLNTKESKQRRNFISSIARYPLVSESYSKEFSRKKRDKTSIEKKEERNWMERDCLVWGIPLSGRLTKSFSSTFSLVGDFQSFKRVETNTQQLAHGYPREILVALGRGQRITGNKSDRTD